MEEVERLRRIIDRISIELLHLLEDRQRAVIRIGQEKRRLGMELTDCKRERFLLALLCRRSRGVLSAGAVQQIFRAIIEVSKNEVRVLESSTCATGTVSEGCRLSVRGPRGGAS